MYESYVAEYYIFEVDLCPIFNLFQGDYRKYYSLQAELLQNGKKSGAQTINWY